MFHFVYNFFHEFFFVLSAPCGIRSFAVSLLPNHFTTMESNTSSFNLPTLWEKIKHNARRLGRATTKMVLLMYYVLRSKDTPTSAKVIVYGALAYLVLPINLISARRFRFLGMADEAIAIAIAYKKVSQHVTPEMEQEAEATLDRWFS